MEPWIWVIVVAVALIIEVCSVSLVSIWFGIAGIISLIISFFNTGAPFANPGFIVAEVLVFVAVSCLLLFLVGPIARKALKKKIATNLDAFEGQEVIALSDVTKLQNGKAKYKDVIYTIKSDEEIKAGEVVVIVGLEGNKLIVKKQQKKIDKK